MKPSYIFAYASIALLLVIVIFPSTVAAALLLPFIGGLVGYMVLDIANVQHYWDEHTKWHFGGSALLTVIVYLLFDALGKLEALHIAESVALTAGIWYEWAQRERMPTARQVTIRIDNSERGEWLLGYARKFLQFFTADMRACAGDAWWNIAGVAVATAAIVVFII